MKKYVKGFSLIELLIVLILLCFLFSSLGGITRLLNNYINQSKISTFYKEVNSLQEIINQVEYPTLINYTPNSLQASNSTSTFSLDLSSSKVTIYYADTYGKEIKRVFTHLDSLTVNKINSLHYKIELDENLPTESTLNYSTKLEMYEIILNPIAPKNSNKPWWKEVIYYVP